MANTILCGSGCDTVTMPQSYHSACDGKQLRKQLFPYFALVNCDVAIPAPTDIAAWTSLCASGDVALSPKGNLVIPKPSQTTSDNVDPCVGTVVLESIYNLTFTTYNAKKGEDCMYWKQLLKNYSNLRLIWFDCDGCAYMTDEYLDFANGGTVVPTGNPGFQFSIAEIPHPLTGDGNKAAWEVTFQVKLDGEDMFCYAEVPGLLTALQTCQNA